MNRLKGAFMRANWFTLLIIGVLVILPFAQLPFVLGGGSGGSGTEFYQEGDDIVSLRTENSKTYSLGKGEYQIEISSGIIHYKDNYANSTEPWKDINLEKWNGEYLDTAPYILKFSKNEKRLFFTDKITNATGTIQLQSVNPPQLDYEIVPFNEGVSFQFEVSAGTDFRVKYKVTGNVTLITRAYDDEGEIELAVTYNENSGELTESLDARGKVKDKAKGNDREIKGKVRVDPTITIQPDAGGEDTYISDAAKDTPHGGETSLNVGLSSSKKYRSIIEFPVTWSSLPAGSTLTTATMSLYCYAYSPPYIAQTINVHRMLRLSWLEASATWNNYMPFLTWGVAGCSQIGTDISGSDVASTIVTATGWVNWNILAQVNTAKTGNINVAVRIADSTEALWRSQFYSSDYGTASSRPKLVITYVSPPTMTTSASSNIMPTYFTANGEITHTGDVAVTTRGFCYKEAAGATSSWVSPTGHNDLDAWVVETQAYDGNTGTAAFTVTVDGELELTIASIICNKVQIHAYEFSGGSANDPEVTISVYYSGAYHEIWSGSITKSTQVEKSIGSTQYVTKAKISFNSITGTGYLSEFQFATPTPPTTSDDKVYETGSWAAYPTAYSLVIGEGTYGEDELVPETDYLVRAYGSNTQGTGYGSTIITTTIAPAAPEVDTAACSDIHATSMEGNGEITYWGGDNATRRGFAYTEDLKYALDFNGVSDYVVVSTSSSSPFRQSSAITYSFWVKMPADGGTYTMGTAVSGGQGSGGVSMDLSSIYFYWTPTTPASDRNWRVTGLSLTPDTLYHIAITMSFSGASSGKIYVNGVDQSATISVADVTDGTPKTTYNTANGDSFGSRYVNSRRYFKGSLDEIRLWNKVLTQEEIQADMYSELAGSESGLVGYWKLNEGTGITAEDSTSYNNDGTITGAAWVYQSWDLDLDNPNYQSNGGSLSTSLFTTSGYNTINFNSVGLGWINKGGQTKFFLRSDRDIAGIEPTGNELVQVFASEETGIDKDPYLSVTYTTPTEITVTIYSSASDGDIILDAATYPTVWSATIGFPEPYTWCQIGQLLAGRYYLYRTCLFFDTSIIPADATILSAFIGLYGMGDYSTTDFLITVQNGQPIYPHDPMVGGDYNKGNYINTRCYEDGSFSEGEYSLTIDDLTPETDYRVRAFAENIGGIGYGDVVAAQTLVAGHPYSWGYILGA